MQKMGVQQYYGSIEQQAEKRNGLWQKRIGPRVKWWVGFGMGLGHG